MKRRLVVLAVALAAALAVLGFASSRKAPRLISPFDLAAGGTLEAVDADFDGKVDVVDLAKGPWAELSPESAYAALAQANVQEPGGPVLRPSSGPLGYWQFWDFTKDSEVTNDNDTDSGQSPVSYPDWTYTVTGTTAPTVATHAVGGTLVVTNAASDNDRIEVDQTAEWIKLQAGKSYRFVFKGAYDCVTAGQADLGFGIGIQDTDWLGDSAVMSDGLFFEVNDGDQHLDLVSAYNASSTSDYVRSDDIAEITDATTFTVVMDVVMDSTIAGQGRVIVWVDGVLVHNALHTGLPYDEELCLKWGLQNGAAEAQKVTVDYIGFTGGR